jgi:predicted Rossmann fold flavoprotein
MMESAGVTLMLQTSAHDFAKTSNGFTFSVLKDGVSTEVTARALVLATGGKSIPKMGASGLAYDVARQFGVPITDIRPGLVPFTFPDGRFAGLAGVATPARVSAGGAGFDEALLFTHRGLSGPAVLQASSYWREGEPVRINLCPETPLLESLQLRRQHSGKRKLTTELAAHLPARLVEHLAGIHDLRGNLADQSDAALTRLCTDLEQWELHPAGTEGYRTAEVTLGGIDTDALSSKTMQVTSVPGLYVIGEAVDVTGWLGGYNFQWAWSSAMAAARALKN